MRKVIIGLCASLVSSVAMCANWTLKEVLADDNMTAGYIYYTSATGTQLDKNTKFVTGLRMICTTRVGSTGEPIIALYWNTLVGSVPQFPEIKVDGRTINTGQWEENGPLLIRPIFGSSELIQAMKTGQTIAFEFTGNDRLRRKTIFTLQDFNNNYLEFIKNCHL